MASLAWQKQGRSSWLALHDPTGANFVITRLGARWQAGLWTLSRNGERYGGNFNRLRDAKARAQGWADSDV